MKLTSKWALMAKNAFGSDAGAETSSATEAGADQAETDVSVSEAGEQPQLSSDAAAPETSDNDDVSVTAAEQAIYDRGVSDAGDRFVAIMSSEEAEGRMELALALAGQRMTAEAVIATLAKAPKAASASALSNFMDANADTAVSDDGGTAPSTPGARIYAAMQGANSKHLNQS